MNYLLQLAVILAIITTHSVQANFVHMTCSGSFLGTNHSRLHTPEIGGGATRMKNRVKGPADLGVYYINSPGASCGGFATAVCSKSCGSLGYPVYWCYPKLCYCHYGNSEEETNGIEDEVPLL